MTATEPVRFTVVTPTHGRPASLLRMLDALTRQEYRHDLYEVLVVLDGPDPGTLELLHNRRFPYRLRVLTQARGGPAAARNRGLAEAVEPYVLFLDDDVVPAPSLVREHAASHAGADAVVMGPLMPASNVRPAPWTRWEWATLLEQYEAMTSGDWTPTPRQFYTGNASVRIDHVRAAGGFDPQFMRGEDVELAWRLYDRGVRFIFNPHARAEHLAQRSFEAWLAAAHEYGRTDVMLGKKRGGFDVPGWVPDEFHRRHRYTRVLTRTVLSVPVLWPAASQAGRFAAMASAAAGASSRSNDICSALFTAAYWRGVSSQIGRPDVMRLLAERSVGTREEAA